MTNNIRQAHIPSPSRDVVIAIDGPAASGKSTVAKALAKKLGFRYMDTGAMYRALTFLAIRKGLNLEDEDALEESLKDSKISLEESPGGGIRVLADGMDVTQDIRLPEITDKVFYIARSQRMRTLMRKAQREFASKGPTIAEGRDMASVVFPQSKIKFYLDADERERARRRSKELKEKGIGESFQKVLSDIRERDKKDFDRSVAPLKKTPDAIYVDTTHMKIEEVVSALIEKVNEKLKGI